MFTSRLKATSESAHGNDRVAAAISTLLLARCPLAVSWFIATVIIYPFNGKPFGAIAHIVQEIDERFSPFSADTNAAASVIMKTVPVWVFTAVNHSRPTLIDQSTVQPMSNRRRISTDAALPTFSPCQRTVKHSRNCTALARNNARSLVSATGQYARWSIAQHFPFAKGAPNKREFRRHNVRLSISNVVFSSGRPARTGARCDLIKAA